MPVKGFAKVVNCFANPIIIKTSCLSVCEKLCECLRESANVAQKDCSECIFHIDAMFLLYQTYATNTTTIADDLTATIITTVAQFPHAYFFFDDPVGKSSIVKHGSRMLDAFASFVITGKKQHRPTTKIKCTVYDAIYSIPNVIICNGVEADVGVVFNKPAGGDPHVIVTVDSDILMSNMIRSANSTETLQCIIAMVQPNLLSDKMTIYDATLINNAYIPTCNKIGFSSKLSPIETVVAIYTCLNTDAGKGLDPSNFKSVISSAHADLPLSITLMRKLLAALTCVVHGQGLNLNKLNALGIPDTLIKKILEGPMLYEDGNISCSDVCNFFRIIENRCQLPWRTIECIYDSMANEADILQTASYAAKDAYAFWFVYFFEKKRRRGDIQYCHNLCSLASLFNGPPSALKHFSDLITGQLAFDHYDQYELARLVPNVVFDKPPYAIALLIKLEFADLILCSFGTKCARGKDCTFCHLSPEVESMLELLHSNSAHPQYLPNNDTTPVCKFYQTGCKNGMLCKFKHE